MVETGIEDVGMTGIVDADVQISVGVAILDAVVAGANYPLFSEDKNGSVMVWSQILWSIRDLALSFGKGGKRGESRDTGFFASKI
ncbi:hypothetical protein C7R93_06325 [Brevibacillus fortis]|uniref:Uncharacterized protein n=1 Tax=Brevibacillus fortis TaxID=2126352 RepID=A0A2P7VH57_9BACL|nr:hypothetical protein C7R93_06325 [Brevibacillus fortis]